MTNNAASAVSGTVLSDLGVDPTDIDIDDVTEGELRYLQKQEHLKKKKPFLNKKWGGVIDDQVNQTHAIHSLTHSYLFTHSLTHTYSLSPRSISGPRHHRFLPCRLESTI